MESLYRAIQRLQKRLADAGIPSIVIGGIAVGIWGEPRATRDADLKIQLERRDAERLLTVLAPAYASLLPDPREALRRQAMLFVHDADGIRMDLLLADTSYDVVAIQRGSEVEVEPGVTLRRLRSRLAAPVRASVGRFHPGGRIQATHPVAGRAEVNRTPCETPAGTTFSGARRRGRPGNGRTPARPSRGSAAGR